MTKINTLQIAAVCSQYRAAAVDMMGPGNSKQIAFNLGCIEALLCTVQSEDDAERSSVLGDLLERVAQKIPGLLPAYEAGHEFVYGKELDATQALGHFKQMLSDVGIQPSEDRAYMASAAGGQHPDAGFTAPF